MAKEPLAKLLKNTKFHRGYEVYKRLHEAVDILGDERLKKQLEQVEQVKVDAKHRDLLNHEEMIKGHLSNFDLLHYTLEGVPHPEHLKDTIDRLREESVITREKDYRKLHTHLSNVDLGTREIYYRIARLFYMYLGRMKKDMERLAKERRKPT